MVNPNMQQNVENRGARVKEEIKNVGRLVKKEQRVLGRIPLFFLLLSSFGLVSIFYGFEKILDQTALTDQPILMIGVGIVLLLATGSIANKL